MSSAAEVCLDSKNAGLPWSQSPAGTSENKHDSFPPYPGATRQTLYQYLLPGEPTLS
jgi:hypothetical protein